jgi:YegS/Rv2252/BmrU family lipid kinase
MKKKTCFIVNPVSGFGKQKIIEKLIDQHLDLKSFDFKIVYTKAAKHATELAKQAVSDNFDIVVAVGGDGSVNEIARGLIGSNTALAIVPAGSGNGLARYLNIPLKLKKAIETINNGKAQKVDTMQLNKEQFINVAGLGFDAFIGSKIALLSKRGFLAYFKLIAQEFYKYKEQDFEIIIDGKLHQKSAFLICFANGPQWGYNAHISPKSNNTDGIFEIAILKDVTIFNILKLSFQLLNKTIYQSPNLEVIKAKEAIIKQTNSIAHVDGEPVEVGNTIIVKIFPLSLNVIVP